MARLAEVHALEWRLPGKTLIVELKDPLEEMRRFRIEGGGFGDLGRRGRVQQGGRGLGTGGKAVRGGAGGQRGARMLAGELVTNDT